MLIEYRSGEEILAAIVKKKFFKLTYGETQVFP